MKVKIRYNELFAEYDINDNEADKFAKSLKIRNFSKFSKRKRQEILQEYVDVEFNRPEYNNMHKLYRHKGNVLNIPNDDNFYSYDYMDLLPDHNACEYLYRTMKNETICKYIRRFFQNKPEYASVVIAIYIDDLSIDEYARLCRRDRTTISRRLNKALKMLKNDKTYKFLHELCSLVAI